MERHTLEVQRRSVTGTSAVKRLRNNGLTPSIVYCHGEESVPLQLNTKEFEKVGRTVKSSQIFTFKAADKALDGRAVIVKEIARDFVKERILHIDFQALREDEAIGVRIPLRFAGEAPGVKNQGGILSIMTHDVAVRCLPKLIPSDIEVSIAELGLGDNIHASDLKLPEGVELDENPEETIVSVVAPKAVVEETAVSTAATTEGEAVAEGDAAKAGTDAAPAQAKKEEKSKDKDK